MSVMYLIGDIPRLITPKGLIVSKDIGMKMPLYVGNYKGGRNESFMYGIDTGKV